MPSVPSTITHFQLTLRTRQSRPKWGQANGNNKSSASAQRQKASETGGITLRAARPTSELPAQNSAVKVSNR